MAAVYKPPTLWHFVIVVKWTKKAMYCSTALPTYCTKFLLIIESYEPVNFITPSFP